MLQRCECMAADLQDSSYRGEIKPSIFPVLFKCTANRTVNNVVISYPSHHLSPTIPISDLGFVDDIVVPNDCPVTIQSVPD